VTHFASPGVPLDAPVASFVAIHRCHAINSQINSLQLVAIQS